MLPRKALDAASAGIQHQCGLLSRLAQTSAVQSSNFGPQYSTSSANDIYDVVIVGGGLVGSAMAAALSTNPWTEGLRVAVLDRQAPPEASSALSEFPELRVSTITPQSIELLKRCTDWQNVAPPRSVSFFSMQVWDWGGNGYVRYHASDIGRQEIGFVAENSVLLTAFLRTLERPGRPPVFQYPAIVENLSLPPYSRQGTVGLPLAEIELKDGTSIKTKLVIGADGARSQVRGLADLRATSYPYHQRGLVASVRTEPENFTAHQRFLETGPLALLPVRAGFSNIVWSTTPSHAKELEGLNPQQFAGAVNEALFGGIQPDTSTNDKGAFEYPPAIKEYVGTSPKSFPLVYSHTGRYVRPRLALIGDAAHSIHPLAGQGVNLGFGDVSALEQTLAHAVECGRDLGELSLLEEQYEKPRKEANQQMMTACDGLLKLYGPQEGFLANLRHRGLNIINSSDFARKMIMKYAIHT